MIVPRIIWMMWAQGEYEAPPLVRACIESWRELNPNWEVRVLDNTNFRDWITLTIPEEKFRRLCLAHQAAHIRLRLLEKYGGVWVDSTCLCSIPLERWLWNINHNGFFAFRWNKEDVLNGSFGKISPGRNRIVASWFLVANEGNYTVKRLSEKFSDYWTNNTLCNKKKGPILRVVRKILNRKPEYAALWMHPFITKALRIHPYLVVNAVFTNLLKKDETIAEQWNAATDMSAVPSHALQMLGLTTPASFEMRAELARNQAPMQKLDHRVDLDNAPNDSIIKSYILSRLDTSHRYTV